MKRPLVSMNAWGILEIGNDYLLSAKRDELGIERVRIYEVQMPPG